MSTTKVMKASTKGKRDLTASRFDCIKKSHQKRFDCIIRSLNVRKCHDQIIKQSTSKKLYGGNMTKDNTLNR